MTSRRRTAWSWSVLAAELGASWPLVALVLLFSLFRYLHTLTKLMVDSPFIDFAHYYTYATMVARVLNPFDASAVARTDALLAIRRAGAPANYPPPFYLLMQPWTILSFRMAAVLWQLISQAFLLGSFICCRRRFESATAVRIAMVAFVVLNYQPLIEDLALGQVNTALLFLAALAWWGLQRGHSWIAAMAVAAAPLLKIQYSLLFVLLWWVGARRVVACSLLLFGLAGAAGLAVLGPAHYREYFRYIFSLTDSFYLWTANLSPRGAFLRLFGLSGTGPLIAGILVGLLIVGLLILTGWVLPRSASLDSPGGDWVWGLGLTMIPILSPLTEEHHLVILLLPLTFLLLDEGRTAAPMKDCGILLIATVLLGSAYSLDGFSLFRQGLPSLLAEGKLLGAGLLAWVLIRRLQTYQRLN